VKVGVLGLQGDFSAHAALLRTAGAEVEVVRRPGQLSALPALVMPGGESTALLRLMEREPWFDAIRELHARGGALLGTCAGAILLARSVTPSQPSLGLIDLTVARNGYGRQIDSFEAPLSGQLFGHTGVFIRAPRIVAVGSQVEILASLGHEPVAVREGRVLAATFHPELVGDAGLHSLLLEAAYPDAA
jgi:5'-phosphate synthase pdxT subunit